MHFKNKFIDSSASREKAKRNKIASSFLSLLFFSSFAAHLQSTHRHIFQTLAPQSINTLCCYSSLSIFLINLGIMQNWVELTALSCSCFPPRFWRSLLFSMAIRGGEDGLFPKTNRSPNRRRHSTVWVTLSGRRRRRNREGIISRVKNDLSEGKRVF